MPSHFTRLKTPLASFCNLSTSTLLTFQKLLLKSARKANSLRMRAQSKNESPFGCVTHQIAKFDMPILLRRTKMAHQKGRSVCFFSNQAYYYRVLLNLRKSGACQSQQNKTGKSKKRVRSVRACDRTTNRCSEACDLDSN